MESNELVYVSFWDMHSGGGLKEDPYHKIYIQAASEEEATIIFYNRFGHNPSDIACTSCGSNYAVDSDPSLEQITGYHRGCAYDGKSQKYVERVDRKNHKSYRTLEEYLTDPGVLLIRADEVKEDEKHGEVPTGGWVWMG